ncbi:MAG: hypothetical protein PHC91_02235 [Eubacteriales bacterium]|nr:hypothetical protein [Eubacteriales bacterium]
MLIKRMPFFIPESIKKKKLNELFRLTADAFGCDLPERKKLSFQEALQEYALFTKEQAERCLQEETEIEEVKHRLYQNSFLFGMELSSGPMQRVQKKPAAALEIIYRLIGISFQSAGQGEFIIKHCFFSNYYTAEVCMLISSLDEGLSAGLTGRRLCFTQRITEGCSCCKGVMK